MVAASRLVSGTVSAMSMMSPTTMALTTTAMMVAMMLPSIAPVVWRYHRHLCAAHATNPRSRTLLLVGGYSSVWTLASLALFLLTVTASPTGMPSMGPSFAPLTMGVVALCVGFLQCSRWKERQLLRCRECVEPHEVMTSISSAWRAGVRLGVDCCLSCAGLMSVLFVAGLMEMRMMLTISAAITAERVLPSGRYVARLTGALALIAGVVLCVRAIAATALG